MFKYHVLIYIVDISRPWFIFILCRKLLSNVGNEIQNGETQIHYTKLWNRKVQSKRNTIGDKIRELIQTVKMSTE